MLETLTGWYLGRGMPPEAAVETAWWTSLGTLVAAACILHFLFRLIVVRLVKSLVGRLKFKAPATVIGAGLPRWVSHLIPAIFLHSAAPGFLGADAAITPALQAFALLYLLLAAVLALYSLLNGFARLYEQRPMARRVPATSFVQVAKLLIALAALVLAVSILIDRSPVIIFSGLGAMTAVLLLVFKDAILGFVAGIQLAANRMISVGDWIEMPKYGADGDVEEVGLTTVKVRNWDRTRTTIPTYALISDSFKNWRGMQESGGRRIKRSLHIDMHRVRLLDDKLRAHLEKIRLLEDYLRRKDEEIRAWCESEGYSAREEAGINGRRLTNLGTFRAYIEAYLKKHPKIHQDMTLLVRHMPPDERGLPMEIYCFTNDIRWAHYEGIQSDIFEHLIAMAAEFDLGVFQEPSGGDIRHLAGMNGKSRGEGREPGVENQ